MFYEHWNILKTSQYHQEIIKRPFKISSCIGKYPHNGCHRNILLFTPCFHRAILHPKVGDTGHVDKQPSLHHPRHVGQHGVGPGPVHVLLLVPVPVKHQATIICHHWTCLVFGHPENVLFLNPHSEQNMVKTFLSSTFPPSLLTILFCICL